MKKSTIKIVLAFTILFLSFQVAQSQNKSPNENPYDYWNNGIGHSSWMIGTTVEERKQLLEIWNSIGEDLKTESNELAGTYVNGGYSNGYFFRWSNKEYILIPYYDQNLITDYSYGKVSFVDNSEVNFTPVKDLIGYRSMAKMPRQWTAVFNYFVPVGMLKDFGMFRAGLGVYNEFNGQCCEWKPSFIAKKIIGKRVSHPVPAKYKSFIKNPIEGKIIFVGKKKIVKNWGFQGETYGQWMDKTALIPVKINVGRKHGVKKNMLFRLIDNPDFSQYLQIMKVNSTYSKGFIVRPFTYEGKEEYWEMETDTRKPFPPILKNIKVTTNPSIF